MSFLTAVHPPADYRLSRNYNHGMLLEGIFAAVTTCFYPDGRPYWRKLEQNVDRYSRTPMSGMVLLGSTGEAVVLSDEESRQALRVAGMRARRTRYYSPESAGKAYSRPSARRIMRQRSTTTQSWSARPTTTRKQLPNREMLKHVQAVADRSPPAIASCTAYPDSRPTTSRSRWSLNW